jgi:hypothetical protein
VSAPGKHARPSRFRTAHWRWYLLPMPLAVALVLLMPWLAVRDVRQSNRAFGQLCDVMLRAHQRRQEAAAAAAEPERPRLYLVK